MKQLFLLPDEGSIILQKNLHLCDYGCNQIANYQLKNSKWCCSDNPSKCPKIRKLISDRISEHFKLNNITHFGTGRALTKQDEILRRKKISETMKRNKRCGGYRPGSGRGKEGWYKGFWCDSSWELAYTIYNIDHNIEFKRYQGYFEYQFNNQIFKYYPDYILSDGTIVEIKGREQDLQWKAKLEQFPKNLKLEVIDYITIKPYLEYVIKKYGKDFISLYENKST